MPKHRTAWEMQKGAWQAYPIGSRRTLKHRCELKQVTQVIRNDHKSMSTKVKITPHGERAILITRSFKAPRELVFAAMSQAENGRPMASWPAGMDDDHQEMDLRVGGRYRWVWTNADGREGMGAPCWTHPPSLLKTTEQFGRCLVRRRSDEYGHTDRRERRDAHVAGG